MSGKKTIINIVISIVVIVIVVFAYRLFFPKTATLVTDSSSLLITVTPNSRLEPSDEFLKVLLSLEEIKFQTETFEEINQNKLRDFSTQLVPRDPGRLNPFAPIGFSGVATTSKFGLATTTNAATGTPVGR